LEWRLKTNLKLLPDFEAADAAEIGSEIAYRVRDVVGIAQKRIGNTREAARRLRLAAADLGTDPKLKKVANRAMREAFMIERCAANENYWVGQYLDSENPKTGAVEAFDGLGTLCACGSRLCESCSADLRRRSRRRARAGLAAANAVKEDDEAIRFVTLTTPTPQGASQEEAIKFINGCWRRLQKKEFWNSRVRGSIKGVEAPWGAGGHGFHPHIHTVVVSKWIERSVASENESRDWRADKDAFYRSLEPTPYRSLKETDKQREWGLCMLASKPALGNLQAVWNECLLAEIKARGWRLITNERKAKKRAALLKQGAVVLDWRSVRKAGAGLMVGIENVKSKGKRGNDSISYEDAISEVLKYVCKAEDWFKLPASELIKSATVKRWPRMFELSGTCKGSTEKESDNVASDATAYLDTPCLSAAEISLGTGSVRETESGEKEIYIEGGGWVAAAAADLVSFMYEVPLPPPPAPEPVALPRAKSLRRLGEIMEAAAEEDESGKPGWFEKWCALVEARWAERRHIRRRLLAEQFQHASFWTLDGRRWGLLPVVEEVPLSDAEAYRIW
jgi:hypothetical protein